MASKATEPALTDSAASELKERVAERFGVLPNFFRLASETPEITEKMWGFAQAAYLDNPLPSVFKERLFVHLSRFCAARYCITRHGGFLMGLGRPAGDANAPIQGVEDVVKLLQRPFPRGTQSSCAFRFVRAVQRLLWKCQVPTRKWRRLSLRSRLMSSYRRLKPLPASMHSNESCASTSSARSMSRTTLCPT